jgi:hypothetical protein
MRYNYIILGLLVISSIVAMFMYSDPQQSERLAEMRRAVTLTGETRETVILLLALGIGGFVAYLTLSRR